MNNDLRILLNVAIDTDKAIQSINSQISELSKKVDSIKLNIGIDDKTIAQLNQLVNSTDLVKKKIEDLNRVVYQEEQVYKNLDGTIDKFIRQQLASGAIIEKNRSIIDESRKAKEAEAQATIKLANAEEKYGQKLKETSRMNSQGKVTSTNSTFGDQYSQIKVKSNADGYITDYTVVNNIDKLNKDQEKKEQTHNDNLKKIAAERKVIREQLQALDGTGKLTYIQKNSINQSLVSSKSMEDIQRIKSEMGQIESSIKSQIQYQNEQNKLLSQQYQQTQKIAQQEENRIKSLGTQVGSKLGSNDLTGDFSKDSAVLEDYIKKVYGADTSISNLQRTTNSAGQEVWKFSANVDKSGHSVEVVKGNIDKTTLSMYEMSRGLQQAGSDMSAFSRFTTALRTIPAWLGSTTLIFGTIRGFKEMTQTIVDVNTAMTDLKKVMNLDTNFDAVLDSAIQKSQEFAKTITDTLDAYNTFARQFRDQSEISDMASAALVASNVGEIKAGDAAGYLTSAIVQFKLETKDAMSVVDAWNNISNKNATTVENLAQGVAKAGSTARSFGLDMNQLNAIIGTVTETTKQSGKFDMPLMLAIT